MSFSPTIPNPITDFLFFLAPQHRHVYQDPICVKIESRFLNCLEAYGTLRAREKCAEYMYDMVECSELIAQKKRAAAMMNERMKQYRAGKLAKPFEEYPPLDSYLFL